MSKVTGKVPLTLTSAWLMLSWLVSLAMLLVSLAHLAMSYKGSGGSAGNTALLSTQDTVVKMLLSFHYRKRQPNEKVITSGINLRQWNVQGRGLSKMGSQELTRQADFQGGTEDTQEE